MTLASFIDASYTLLVEEHQRIDPFKDLVSLAELLVPLDAPSETAPSPREVEKQNQESLAQLQLMMSGVSRR